MFVTTVSYVYNSQNKLNKPQQEEGDSKNEFSDRERPTENI